MKGVDTLMVRRPGAVSNHAGLMSRDAGIASLFETRFALRTMKRMVASWQRNPSEMVRCALVAALLGVALVGVVFVGPALAVEPEEILKDSVLEARARSISEGLRCLVCQNESIDDSHAPLAHDIRVLVRERLQKGDTDAQVVDYMVARYGQFILLRPPVETQTLLLWGTPLIALMIGAGGIWIAVRRQPKRDSARPLSEAEQRRLDELLTNKPAGS